MWADLLLDLRQICALISLPSLEAKKPESNLFRLEVVSGDDCVPALSSVFA